jgi:hypothetical protein
LSLTELANVLQASRLSHAIAKSNHLLIAALQIVHVLGITLLLASLCLITLRLWGLLLAQRSAAQVVREASGLLWLGVVLAITSGTFMFLGSPRHYVYNPAFEVKMTLLVLAIVAELMFLRAAAAGRLPRIALKLGAGLSFSLWLAVGVAGRAIGFV